MTNYGINRPLYTTYYRKILDRGLDVLTEWHMAFHVLTKRYMAFHYGPDPAVN